MYKISLTASQFDLLAQAVSNFLLALKQSDALEHRVNYFHTCMDRHYAIYQNPDEKKQQLSFLLANIKLWLENNIEPDVFISEWTKYDRLLVPVLNNKVESDDGQIILMTDKEQIIYLNFVSHFEFRFLCSQIDLSYHEIVEDYLLCEQYYKRRKDFDTWMRKRDEFKEYSNELHCLVWNVPINSLYGINYSDEVDILFDIHGVLRHQLWLEQENRNSYTVDATVHHWGKEPLVVIEVITN
jgi:hypothetical protein